MGPVKEGDVLAGKYRVERVLGEGGMGVVVAAWHIELEQRVALKFLLPEIAERGDAAERFRREARAAVKIKSEHVARVIDVGTMDDGVPYMVMEYLDGHDLASELRERRTLDVTEAVDIVLQACEAVAEAHASGIVHRDLKPANLYLALRADGSRVVKVLDFGISKSIAGGSLGDLSLTRTSSMIGSPLYMSPEQMRSARDVDSRADIWSLGVILFELLTGRPPYLGDNVPQLCASLLNDSPPPLSDYRNDVPKDLERCLLKCLEKERTQRWPSVAELAHALAPLASPESRIHALRASRVLGITEVSLNMTLQAFSASGEPAPVTERIPELPLVAPPEPPREASTVDSWGRTGDPVPEPSRGSKRWIAIAGAAAVVAIGGVVLLSSRLSAAPAAGTAPSARPVTAQASLELPPAQPAVAPVPPPAAVDSALAPPSASAVPSALAVPRLAPPSRPRPRANPKPAKHPSTTGLPDFGGRE